MGARTRGIGVACLGALLATACGEGGAAPSAPAASAAGAASVQHGEPPGFTLTRPGPGWLLLDAEAARGLVPDALAGAISTDGVTGVVLDRPPSSEGPARDAEALVASLRLDDLSAQPAQACELAGVAARRILATGSTAGVSLRYAAIVATRASRSVQMLAWTDAARPCANGDCFTPFVSALSWTESAPAPSASATVAAQAEELGVGWRLHEGTFESARSGLRLRAPEGWRLVVGRELAAIDPSADVELRTRDGSVRLTLRSAPSAAEPGARSQPMEVPPAPGAPLGARLCAAPAMTPPTKPALTPLRLGALDWQLAPAELSPASAFIATTTHEGRCLLLDARAPAAQRGQPALELASQALGAVSYLSAGELRPLNDALGQVGEPHEEVGTDFTLRAGTYVDFRWRFAWERKTGPWQLRPGDTARQLGSDVRLVLEHATLGIRAALAAESAPSDTAASFHERAVRRWLALPAGAHAPPLPKATSERLAEHDVLSSERESLIEGSSIRSRVSTLLEDGRALTIVVSAPSSVWAPHADTVAAPAAGLQLRPSVVPLENKGEEYRDHRLGFGVRVPSGWAHSDVTPPELAATGSFVRWEQDGRWLGVLAVCLPGAAGATSTIDSTVGELLRGAVSPFARGAPVSTEQPIAGVTARRLAWGALGQRLEVAVLRRRGTVVALLGVDHTEEPFRQLAESLVLLP